MGVTCFRREVLLGSDGIIVIEGLRAQRNQWILEIGRQGKPSQSYCSSGDTRRGTNVSFSLQAVSRVSVGAPA
jgi:hypothetical protein